MPKQSNLNIEQQEGVSLVSFVTATMLDSYHVQEVTSELYDLVEKEGHTKIVIDLSSVKMISSQALSVLLNLRKKSGDIGGKIVISGIDPQLYRVFKITHLQKLFDFYSDNEQAVKALVEGE